MEVPANASYEIPEQARSCRSGKSLKTPNHPRGRPTLDFDLICVHLWLTKNYFVRAGALIPRCRNSSFIFLTPSACLKQITNSCDMKKIVVLPIFRA